MFLFGMSGNGEWCCSTSQMKSNQRTGEFSLGILSSFLAMEILWPPSHLTSMDLTEQRHHTYAIAISRMDRFVEKLVGAKSVLLLLRPSATPCRSSTSGDGWVEGERPDGGGGSWSIVAAAPPPLLLFLLWRRSLTGPGRRRSPRARDEPGQPSPACLLLVPPRPSCVVCSNSDQFRQMRRHARPVTAAAASSRRTR